MRGELLVAYAGGSLTQAALVAGASAGLAPAFVRSLHHRAFALLPLAALVGVALGLRRWPQAAGPLATGALVLVPLLALVAAARMGRGALLVAGAMLAAALAGAGSLAGQLGALGLIAGSCLLLGTLLVAVTPPRWLYAGIAATALADLVLVASGLMAPASDALNAAWAAEGLPRLQRVELGTLTLGYGDVFVPALVGALLAAGARPRRGAAALTLLLSLGAGAVILLGGRLPATVPAALALVLVEVAGSRPAVR